MKVWPEHGINKHICISVHISRMKTLEADGMHEAVHGMHETSGESLHPMGPSVCVYVCVHSHRPDAGECVPSFDVHRARATNTWGREAKKKTGIARCMSHTQWTDN